MSITAPTRIKPESRVTISWSGGNATYTVRILVNSHESSELKSIADTWYTWTAQGVKDGDQVQFYVYDSSGASTKSPHIPVRLKGDSSDTSSKIYGSKTKQQVTSEAAETYSESKATLKEGGNEVVKSTKSATTSTATGTRSGRIPTAPPQSSYVPESTTTPLSQSGTSSSSSIVPTSDASTPETMAAPATSPAAASATATAEPATPSSTGVTASTSPDRTNLYLGLIGILIALVLLLVLVCATGDCETRTD
ncbi:hypothetical protein RHOSPDRAFT_33055 [Rhodotorula sp. JG-1b]|nr:hypothetical protein RHOSPDRAFT_33055 [Rhodotorula sp. JG-1b]